MIDIAAYAALGLIVAMAVLAAVADALSPRRAASRKERP